MDDVINLVLQGLRALGYPARRSMPGCRVSRVEETCCAVSLHGLQAGPGAAVLAEVQIYVASPGADGAEACEKAAARVAGALASGLDALAGCACRCGACGYDSAGDWFYVKVTAQIPAEVTEQGLLPEGGLLSGGPARILRGTELAATAAKWEASTVREVKPVYGFGDGQPAGLSAGDTRYVLTLEELVPEAGQPDTAALSNFQVEICRAGRMVTYTGCVWKRFRQTRTASGSRLTAEAEAAGYTEV